MIAGRNLVETVLGAVVVLVAGLFVSFAYTIAEIRTVDGYQISARFYRIGGLKKGSDVRVSGIKVGSVFDHRLDPETFDAIVTLTVAGNVRLPADTVASIAVEGLLGDKYVRLDPGKDKSYIAAGGSISRTKDFRTLEDQVGEIIFLATGGPEPGGGGK